MTLDPEAQRLLDKFIDQRRTSAQEHLAGVYGFPVGRAEGCWVFDEAGRGVLDFGIGGQTHLLGHRNEQVRYALHEHGHHYLYTGEDHLAAFPVKYAETLAGHLPAHFRVAVVPSVADARSIADAMPGTVLDQTRTGLGRTGRMWSQDPTAADVVLIGPSGGGGLPFAAVAAHKRLWDGITLPPMTNHPLLCVAGLVVLKQITDDLLDHVERMGAVLAEGLAELTQQFSFLRPPNGVGLLQFLKTSDTEQASEFREQCLARGLILHPDLALTPPLTVTEQEVRQAIDILADVCLDWR